MSNNRTNFDPNLKFGFSVYHVSANMFLHFIDRIQSDYKDYLADHVNFKEIDWKELIYNSFELGHFTE